MKELSLENMEEVTGGGFINGACAVIGFGGAGLAVRPQLAWQLIR